MRTASPTSLGPRRLLALGVSTVGLLLGLSLGPAAASHGNWLVDDQCVYEHSYFYLGGPREYWRKYEGAGYNNCHFWTYRTINTIVNDARWYLPVNSGRNGEYDLFAYIPCVGTATTKQAYYYHYRQGSAGGALGHNTVSQWNYCNQWGLVGADWYFWANLGGYERLVDRTFESDLTRVGADAYYYIESH